MLPFVETALQITLDAGPVFEETVVVIGLGVVGLLTALLLQRAGRRTVIAVEPRRWRRELAPTLGRRAVAPDDVDDGVGGADRAAGDGVPLVIEASGNPAGAAPTLCGCSPTRARRSSASWYGTQDAALPLGRPLPPPAPDDPQHSGLDDPGSAVGTLGPGGAGARVVALLGYAAARRPGHAHRSRSTTPPRPTPRSTPAQEGLIHAALGVQLSPCSRSAPPSSSPRQHIMPGVEGPEGELHEHDYRLEVLVEREQLDDRGMVCDLDVLDAVLQRIDDTVRDKNLEVIHPPDADAVTVEVFAGWAHGTLADELRGTGADTLSVRVYENADAFGGFADRID